MASRFYDTGLSDEVWFRKLSPTMKAVFHFLNNKCNHAGIWEIDLESLKFFIGVDVSMEDLKILPVKFVSNDTKLFIPYFILIQYKCTPEELNPANQVHNSAINILEREGAMAAPHTAPAQGAKDKEEDKESICIKGSVRGDLPPLAKLWNEHCGELPKVLASNNARDARIKQRLKEEPNFDTWTSIIKRVSASDFCNGNNEKGWKADFNWLLQPEVRLKVMEGKYDNRLKIMATDWAQEAQYCFQAVKSFGSSQSAEARKWLGEDRWTRVKAIGGLSFIGSMKHDDFNVKKVADLLKNAMPMETM